MKISAVLFSYLLGTASLFTATSASALLIFQESFEGSNRYSVENGGQNGVDNFFAIVSDSSLDPGYTPTAIDGNRYFGGRDLNGFGSSAPHRVTFDEVDLRGYRDITLTIALSAVASDIYEAGDRLTLDYSSDSGNSFTLLDQFSGATGGAQLSNGTYSLGETLLDISYLLPNTFDNLIFRIQIDTFLAGNEAALFDNFRIEGAASVPEPETILLFGLGLIALRYTPQHRRA